MNKGNRHYLSDAMTVHKLICLLWTLSLICWNGQPYFVGGDWSLKQPERVYRYHQSETLKMTCHQALETPLTRKTVRLKNILTWTICFHQGYSGLGIKNIMIFNFLTLQRKSKTDTVTIILWRFSGISSFSSILIHACGRVLILHRKGDRTLWFKDLSTGYLCKTLKQKYINAILSMTGKLLLIDLTALVFLFVSGDSILWWKHPL